MRNDLPSLTACVVAWARTAASMTSVGSLDPGDAVSRELLPTPLALAADFIVRAGAASSRVPRAVFAISGGLFDHVVLRTAAIDDALKSAIGRGIDQLVILGAGLDGRAHRLRELRDVTVFEVDHPASQVFKQRKARALKVLAAEIRYVAVDFERDRLKDRLREAGFDSTRPSFWIWEGVTPYLHLAAIEETLRVVHGLSAPGSEIVMSYVTHESKWVRSRRVITQSALHAIGEPLRTQLDPGEAATLAFDAGFVVVADTHTADWHAKYAKRPSARPTRSLEHIIHLRR